jgi:hypothetical protein
MHPTTSLHPSRLAHQGAGVYVTVFIRSCFARQSATNRSAAFRGSGSGSGVLPLRRSRIFALKYPRQASQQASHRQPSCPHRAGSGRWSRVPACPPCTDRSCRVADTGSELVAGWGLRRCWPSWGWRPPTCGNDRPRALRAWPVHGCVLGQRETPRAWVRAWVVSTLGVRLGFTILGVGGLIPPKSQSHLLHPTLKWRCHAHGVDVERGHILSPGRTVVLSSGHRRTAAYDRRSKAPRPFRDSETPCEAVCSVLTIRTGHT